MRDASGSQQGFLNRPAAGPESACSPYGFGLRVEHYARILERGVRAEICEALTENFMRRGGRPLAVLERVRRDMPLTLHGVSLSVGAVDPIPGSYLRELRELCRSIEPLLVSDHLCFGSVDGHRSYDLWPLPFTEEALTHTAERVERVQEALGRRICLENVSSYVEFRGNAMPEWEFVSEVARRADCSLLLDVNNVYVSSYNHGFSPQHYISALPVERVAQLHLAGHRDCGGHLLDDHGSAVPEVVWELYRLARRRFGPLPTLLEWDENLPELESLELEASRIREVELDAVA
jgi:uncharacterized protein (UPF0276 family)